MNTYEQIYTNDATNRPRAAIASRDSIQLTESPLPMQGNRTERCRVSIIAIMQTRGFYTIQKHPNSGGLPSYVGGTDIAMPDFSTLFLALIPHACMTGLGFTIHLTRSDGPDAKRLASHASLVFITYWIDPYSSRLSGCPTPEIDRSKVGQCVSCLALNAGVERDWLKRVQETACFIDSTSNLGSGKWLALPAAPVSRRPSTQL
jgi:hypothetical protein